MSYKCTFCGTEYERESDWRSCEREYKHFCSSTFMDCGKWYCVSGTGNGMGDYVYVKSKDYQTAQPCSEKHYIVCDGQASYKVRQVIGSGEDPKKYFRRTGRLPPDLKILDEYPLDLIRAYASARGKREKQEASNGT